MIHKGFIFTGIASINGSLILRHNTLRVTSAFLRFEGGLKEDLVLYPKDVLSISSFGFVPILWRGVKFKMSGESMHGEIVFTFYVNPNRVVDKISEVGFCFG